jgi:predicted acylesterase/phospholipase RssA
MTDEERANAYLAGDNLPFDTVDKLWKALRNAGDLSLARRVLKRLRQKKGLLDHFPTDSKTRNELCQQEALLTSKDLELGVGFRHGRALEILSELDLDGTTDGETLGIAGGIMKRRWTDLGQLDDLIQCERYYARGAAGPPGKDAYSQINAAWVDDVLAEAGEEPATRRARATEIRQRIVRDLPAIADRWFNAASRAEALFGLKRYPEATAVVAAAATLSPPLWELETAARQLATLAHIHQKQPLDNPEIRAFFDSLLPGATQAIRSVMVGKVGLALSGGGFRASFYHLGVLARLSELNVLRHVEVLSCVSGGSIVGAAYWLALRKHLESLKPGEQVNYVKVVDELIDQFLISVAIDVRHRVQPGKPRIALRLLAGNKGALDPEPAAELFDESFYRPFLPRDKPIFMHELPFTPGDYDSKLSGSPQFNPGRHNWLRSDKVPALVINATTVNTGHAWQFTPTWMGESPWAVHEEVDIIPRLQWSRYEPSKNWQITLGRAVAASASVPMVFEPLLLDRIYPNVDVQLVDGGVHDNQGTVSLLAMNCNVVLVSDACGQLLFEPSPKQGLSGMVAYASRSMNTLMERVRLANYTDLAARRQSGLLRGLMFLHMKAGLDAYTVRLPFSSEAYDEERTLLSSSGVRKDFQQALAELRTDLDDFTEIESDALMACGYQMVKKAFHHDLSALSELWEEPQDAKWRFLPMLDEITSIAAGTANRDRYLQDLRAGSKVRI